MGKVCYTCGQDKPFTAFYERQRSRLRGICIACWLEAQRQRRALQGAAATVTAQGLRPLTAEIVPLANRVLRATCDRYGCALSAIRRHDKTAQVCEMRQVATYILTADLRLNHESVALFINHSRFTVRHSVEVIALAIQANQPSAHLGGTTIARVVRDIRANALGEAAASTAALASIIAS